jgi:DNA modification methylase
MPSTVKQISQGLLFPEIKDDIRNPSENGKSSFRDPSFAANKQLPVHRWVPWIAGFSSEFVKGAIEKYLGNKTGTILDPFAGVGTTLLEAIMAGHDTIGFEINPYVALACCTKLNGFRVQTGKFVKAIQEFQEFYGNSLGSSYEPNSTYPEGFKTRGEFYSPKILRKVLIVRDFIENLKDGDIKDLFRVAFASTMIVYSNYSYEPSLGQRKSAGKSEIEDYHVGELIADKLYEMAEDIQTLKQNRLIKHTKAQIWQESFFNCKKLVPSRSVDLLITSPPYLNNYHYNRNTRPQLYWLGFVHEPSEMKPLEENNFGKFWQTVRGKQSIDLEFELESSDLQQKLEHLSSLNGDRGVYGGRGWANYATTYFNDCYRFARHVKHVMTRRGTALIVIGNNILQGITFQTDEYLGQIMSSVGLELVDIHIPRSTRVGSSIIQSAVRVGKAQKSHRLYEAVVEVRKR